MAVEQRIVASTGNSLVAEAFRQCAPDVVAAYPITPQTTIVEEFAKFVAQGRVHTLKGGEKRLIVPLNEGAPTLGTLDPPHAPDDRTARLDVCFGVDVDRWLIATVKDLRTGKTLMDATPVAAANSSWIRCISSMLNSSSMVTACPSRGCVRETIRF